MKAQENFDIKNNSSFLAIGLLLLLPGCLNWFDRKKPEQVKEEMLIEQTPLTGDILVSWEKSKEGRISLVTTNSLKMEKDKLLKTNPQLKAMIAFMDEKQLDRNLSEGLMNQAVVDRYIQENKMNKSADYQAELKEGYKAVERMINTKYFSQSFPVNVTDVEIKDFYEKNKEIVPNLLISRGGVEVMGVLFDNKEKANTFMATVKKEKNLQEAAQKAGLSDKVKDFKLVHSQSIGIEGPLREKIVNMKQVPSTELFNIDDKTFWVVRASKKEKSKYRPLEQVKEDIKQFIEKEKRTGKFEQEMKRLKDEYKVVINDDYFKSEPSSDEVTAEQQKESSNKIQRSARQKIASNKKKRISKQIVSDKKRLAIAGAAKVA